jgi:L-alanine-DL-glutamate epimerase-like enolase superfamily enzyme
MAVATRSRAELPVERLAVSAFTVPTDEPESDGTMEWTSTTLVLVELESDGARGLGYTYADVSTARLVESVLAGVALEADAMRPDAAWEAMSAALRNAGRPGAGMMALSAVDVALHDLRARALDAPASRLLGGMRDSVQVYGSGGFCSYSLDRLLPPARDWVEQGIRAVKLKTSRHPEEDPARLDAVREAIGDDVGLFADANGALSRKQALHWAGRMAAGWGVSWFEEPVSSDDLDGLALLQGRAPAGMDIAAGEYAYLPRDFRELLVHGCVDCLQADVTRCGGFTGLARVSGLCEAWEIELSGHCAPAITAHALCALGPVRHLELFHTHERLERLLFDGVLETREGALRPDPACPGLGLTLRDDARRFQVYGDGTTERRARR